MRERDTRPSPPQVTSSQKKMSVFLKRVASSLYPPRIVCFVCASEGPADYPLYAEPPQGQNAAASSAAVSPHFPFLLLHPPPMGCLPVESTGGEAKACRHCYTTLMRRWDEYELVRFPLTRRTYFIKRADDVPFLTSEQQMQAAMQLQARAAAAAAAAAVMVAPLPPAAVSESSVISLAPPSSVTAAPAGKTIVQHTSSAAAPAVPSPLVAHGWPPPPRSDSSRRTPSRTLASSTTAHEEVTAAVVTTTASSGVGTAAGATLSASADNDSALDLSSGSRERETMKSRSSAASHISAVSHHSSYQSEGAGSSTDILDLTLPDKNAATEVCYVCGDEFKRGTLSFSFAKQMNKEPFYPSLMNHARPPKSRPMDSSGRVQTCDDCHNHLLQQWFKFEDEELPHADRVYTLRKRHAPAQDNATFVCYLCALDYHSSSLRLIYSRPNTEREPYYPFIAQQRPPPGASPISPQGMVQVCNLCYKSTKEKHHGFVLAEQPPPKKRRLEAAAAAAEFQATATEDDEKGLPADITCILCRRKFSVGSFKQLHSRGPPTGGLPYFPFLTTLPRPEEFNDAEEDKLARVRACQACSTSLMNQWTGFQRDGVPIEERTYTYPSLVTGPRSVSSVRAQSPLSQRSGGAVTPVKAASTVDAPTIARARSNTVESSSRPMCMSQPHSPNPHHNQVGPGGIAPLVASPALTATSRATSGNNQLPPTCHSPSFSVNSAASAPPTAAGAPDPSTSTTAASSTCNTVSAQPPSVKSPSSTAATNASSFYCFLCGLHSELSFSRMLYSTPQGKKAPYFPFMRKHVPKNRAETLREDGTALVCTFCYHTVMVQWTRYNETKQGGHAIVDPAHRTYNIHDYNCYVCGITTYRKRIRALRVLVSPI